MSQPRKPDPNTADRLRAEHQREHHDHLAWRSDVERWREEYSRAILDYARRALPALELEAYEEDLSAHEIAIDAHDELVRRHEELLAVEARGGPVTSDEIARFQADIQDRHSRSREKHQLLEIAHRALLQALQLMSAEGEEESAADR